MATARIILRLATSIHSVDVVGQVEAHILEKVRKLNGCEKVNSVVILNWKRLEPFEDFSDAPTIMPQTSAKPNILSFFDEDLT